MDTSEKVKIFDSFEGLTQEILEDMTTTDLRGQRYAIRFIMLNNFNEFKKLALFMTNNKVDSLDIENLIDDGENDLWVTKDTLKNAIKSCKVSTFVTPFSEVVRFYNDDDFRGFFNEIMLLEDTRNPKKRIYVPLIGLQNRFTDFLNHFERIEESAPIWKYDSEPQSVEVYFTKIRDFAMPNDDDLCHLDSLRSWLKFWKVQAPQERIICTSKPISARYKYSRPDNIFNFHQIKNGYEFMTQFLDISFPFAYDEDDNCFWERLLNCIDKKNPSKFSFEKFVRQMFNRVSFTATDVIVEWSKPNADAFSRWLLKNYVLYTGCGVNYPYIKLCIESVTDLDDGHQLPNLIATRILYGLPYTQRTQYSDERRGIILGNRLFFEENITQEEQMWMFERTKEQSQDEEGLEAALEMCTGVFDFERVLLIGWTACYRDKKRVKETVKAVYPDLEAYLESKKPSHFLSEQQWCIDYFDTYKEAKLTDKYLDGIDECIKTYNASSKSFYEWYYSYENSHSVLNELSNDTAMRPDKVYWIDGLGVEYLSYILYLIEKENTNLKVILSEITRSDIPSSTHHNRFEGDNVIKFGALDELGHDSHGYKYLETLKEELKVIRNCIIEILNTCKKEKCTVAIVSDHGMSCLSRKAPSKKYDGNFEHEGRYIKTTPEAKTDHDYLVHQNESDNELYKVALTHSSLSKVPTHEVHGGCTPEEVLVPFILLSNKEASIRAKYQVKLFDEDIMLSNPVIKVTVIPEPNNVTLSCEGKEYQIKRVGTQWVATLDGMPEGVHYVDIKPEGSESTQIKIRIVGVSGNSDIDDLFDL